MSPHRDLAPVVHRRAGAGPPAVALTFDDGPTLNTPPILASLAREGARATFFVEGQRVGGREDVLRRAAAAGHELGNHTFRHHHPARLADGELAAELRWTGRCVERSTGIVPRLVRPPYGEQPGRVARVAAGLGLGPTVLWSVDPRDWIEDDPRAVVRRVLAEVASGDIVLLHDGVRRPSPAVLALPGILAGLRARGLRAVPVGQLLNR